MEGAPEDGKGECIRVSIPCSVEVKGLSITNGYCKSRDTFFRNNRVKMFDLSSDYGRETVSLKDTMEPQKVALYGGFARFLSSGL